jgi:hypothetical protein
MDRYDIRGKDEKIPSGFGIIIFLRIWKGTTDSVLNYV